jgi:hypothetical protein
MLIVPALLNLLRPLFPPTDKLAWAFKVEPLATVRIFVADDALLEPTVMFPELVVVPTPAIFNWLSPVAFVTVPLVMVEKLLLLPLSESTPPFTSSAPPFVPLILPLIVWFVPEAKFSVPPLRITCPA